MKKRLLKCLVAMLLPIQVCAQTGPPPSEILQVQEVRCAGNQQTSCEFIRDHLYLKSGDVLDEEEIRNAELRLSALRNFDSVSIHLEKGGQRGLVIVVIDVRENSPIAMESIAGSSFRLNRELGIFAARVANQNLFGKGKYADVTVAAIVPYSRGDDFVEGYEVWLRYADPQLFDSRRWFGVAVAGYRKQDGQDEFGNFSHLDTAQFDLSVGWRFADFSYLTLGASYRPGIDWIFGNWQTDGTFDYTDGKGYEFSANVAYGWSSEDNLHFPTQGSTLRIAYGGDYGKSSPQRYSHVQFRKTWNWLGSYWTFKLGGEPISEYRSMFAESQHIAFTFARPVRAGDNVIRGRWYIEPGFTAGGFTDTGDPIQEVGLKIGYRADTRTFGIVDLYLMGSVDPTQ